MEKYKAVYYYRENGRDFFFIIKKGECAYCGRRDVIFSSEKGMKKGDAYFIERLKENEKTPQNPFFKKVEKIVSNDKERLQNLIETAKFIIEEDYSTLEEVRKNNHKLDNGVYFIEYLYFMDINECFEAIISYFNGEKQYKFSKRIKNKSANFYQSRYELLGINEGENQSFWGEGYNTIDFIKKIKHTYFSIFTPKQKVVDYIHNSIKDKSIETLKMIEEICNEYLK